MSRAVRLRLLFLSGAVALGMSAGVSAQVGELTTAVKRGDSQSVRALIAEGVADVNETDTETASPLLWAAYRDDLESALLLLEAGADPNQANRYNVTPMQEAVTRGNIDLVEALIEAGANVDAPIYESGQTPIMTAARTGNTDMIGLLLDGGADINATESWRGQTALIWAVVEGHLPAIELLIERGAEIDVPSKYYEFGELQWAAGNVPRYRPRGGLSALHFAARAGMVEAGRMLVDAGADLTIREPQYGYTPLMTAVANMQPEFVVLLINAGADTNDGSLFRAIDAAQANFGSLRPPPEIAVIRRLTELLLDAEANPNAVYEGAIARRNGRRARVPPGSTPLFLASTLMDRDLIALLLDAGADPGVAAGNGATALLNVVGFGRRAGNSMIYGLPLDRESERYSIARLLLEAGADLGATDRATGSTALHIAAWNRSRVLYDLLLEFGADPSAVNRQGMTAEQMFSAEPFSRSPLG